MTARNWINKLISSTYKVENVFYVSESDKGDHTNKHVHMLLVVDEYGGLEGVLTLEDLLERLLGVDIIDEKDTTVSMRRLAKMMTKRKEQMMIKNVPDASLENSAKKK